MQQYMKVYYRMYTIFYRFFFFSFFLSSQVLSLDVCLVGGDRELLARKPQCQQSRKILLLLIYFIRRSALDNNKENDK